jgi:hypothetical protein
MLELPAGAAGLSAVAALDDATINASCVLLMRVEGLFDAKQMVIEDPTVRGSRLSDVEAAFLGVTQRCRDSCAGGQPRQNLTPSHADLRHTMAPPTPQILLDVAKEVARIEAEEAAERAAELAVAEAAEAEAAAEAAAPAPWSSYSAPARAAPAHTPAPAKAAAPARAPAPAPAVRATGEVARVLEALKRSPLMLELPANAARLSAVTSLVRLAPAHLTAPPLPWTTPSQQPAAACNPHQSNQRLLWC